MNAKENLANPENLVDRLWCKDLTLWPSTPDASNPTNWLGWLDIIPCMASNIASISTWADEIAQSGKFDVVILLGMGGSSLAANVFYSVFGKAPGYLKLMVLDTTSPAQIEALDVDLNKSLIIVASKSGDTIETANLFFYLYDKVSEQTENPGSHFIAVTDPDSWLEQKGKALGFTKIFRNPPDIGGRYSALSFFGLVPASLIGVDLKRLFKHTRIFADSTQNGAQKSQVSCLAELMGRNAVSGIDILELKLSKSIQSLAIWIEQLVAESTGKNGLGIIPIYNVPTFNNNLAAGQKLNNGRSSVSIGLSNDGSDTESGLPGSTANMSWRLENRYDLGGEFLRWEMATALAASIMGINPFDQPNVEEAKVITRRIIDKSESPELNLVKVFDDYVIYSSDIDNRAFSANSLDDLLDSFKKETETLTYLGILAFLPMFVEVDLHLENIRSLLAKHFKLSTTLGYGPRYLHSTGQLHKGGPATGCFIQLTEEVMTNVKIPGQKYGFHDLHRAQADGDFLALTRKNLPVMRISLKGDRLKAMEKLAADLNQPSA